MSRHVATTTGRIKPRLICGLLAPDVVVASVVEEDAGRARQVRSVLRRVGELPPLEAGDTISFAGRVFVAADPAGPEQRSFLVDACEVVLKRRLPETTRIVIVEDAETLVENGLLDADTVPARGIYSID